jgi:hypothetical protein
MANFTVALDAGKDRTTAVISAGGATAVAVTVIMDAVKVGSLQEAVNLLDKVRDQILQAPWPPA